MDKNEDKNEYTLIPVSKKTRQRLKHLITKAETYDSFINKILDKLYNKEGFQ